MYKIHKMCFDCTIDYEAQLRKAGLFEAYEKAMISQSKESFAKDLEGYVHEILHDSLNSYVTEQGDVEEWKNNSSRFNEEVLKKLNEYLKYLRTSEE
jgi:L-lactate utilization protein LutB